MNNILLLGDIIIDKYYYGYANRIAPEGGFPIVNVNYSEKFLGCLGNVLENINFYFDNIYLITCIDENNITLLLDKLKKYSNVKHINFHQNNRQLIIKNRIFANNQYISRFDIENINNVNKKNEENILNYIKTIIKNIDIVVFSDYLKGFLTYNLCQNVINISHKNNAVVFVDPKGTNYDKYKNCDLIKPNKKEANDFFGKKINSNNIEEFSLKLLKKYNIKYILNTLGSDGMRFIYIKKDKVKILYKSIIPSLVIDVIGCGDTILAGLCIYYKTYGNFDNNKFFLDILTKLGNIAVNTPNCYKLNKIDWNLIINKKKEKIVFTNGCFDIIHIGHIRYLKECKKYGTKLIIGINSDESIKRLKGKERPINSLSDRIAFLKELNIADNIISFSEDNPLNLIK